MAKKQTQDLSAIFFPRWQKGVAYLSYHLAESWKVMSLNATKHTLHGNFDKETQQVTVEGLPLAFGQLMLNCQNLFDSMD